MALKNLKEGFLIQQQLFIDMTHQFQEELNEMFQFVEDNLQKMDDFIEEQFSTEILNFAKDLSFILNNGVYGQDFIIESADMVRNTFDLKFFYDDLGLAPGELVITFPFDLACDEETLVDIENDYATAIEELVGIGYTRFIE